MTTYITSDLHINHRNIQNYQPNRMALFGGDLDKMNKHIIDYWRDTVKPQDQIYVLGDLFMGSRQDMPKFVEQLTGTIHLIAGNHDTEITHNKDLMKRFDIHKYKEVKVNDTKVCMFHFPIYSWNCKYHGSVHFHGHLHATTKPPIDGRIFDVGIDGHPNFEFYVLEDLVEKIKQIPLPQGDHHSDNL